MAEPDHAHHLHLSKRFFAATEWAAARHAARGDRAGTPSLGQVLGIASLVLEDGGSEREAITAMLLDAVGSDEIPISEIRERFGKKTAALVTRCAEVRVGDDPQDRIRHLEHEDDPSVLRVFAADLLRELRALVLEIRRSGSVTFARFSAPPSEQLARYRSLMLAVTRHDPRGSLTQELGAVSSEVQRLVEIDAANAAWRVAHTDAA